MLLLVQRMKHFPKNIESTSSKSSRGVYANTFQYLFNRTKQTQSAFQKYNRP